MTWDPVSSDCSAKYVPSDFQPLSASVPCVKMGIVALPYLTGVFLGQISQSAQVQ